ncbi:unnamed protein product [Rotaria sp. Silwood1]|nr:unnamed protein product [Rotaria sp. Silwood1]CAF1470549.1 unnamed protein product [Rotaria sp. Silwood1]
MDYDYDDDDHNEDDLPVLPLPTTYMINKTSNNNDRRDNTENDRSSNLLDNWKRLYETSLHSLQSDDDDEDRRSVPKKPFYSDRQLSVENPNIVRSYAPMYQSQVVSNTSKSKWEIRLPQLLNGTVGPDRQKRDFTRRHTTNIVFQASNLNTNEYNSYFPSQASNKATNDRPITPLVKQLKQKFDQMTVDDTPMASSRNHRQFSSDSPSKARRVVSLSDRRRTVDVGERLIQQPRPMLPIRPTPEITNLKTRSGSYESLNNRTPITNSRTQRSKISPPISYPKYVYPPASTTSVVKQLISAGATLVYDSRAESSSSKIRSPVMKPKQNIQKITETLATTNSTLSGRQLRSDSPNNAYRTLQTKKTNDQKLIKQKDDDTAQNDYEAVSLQTSNDVSDNNYVQTANKPFKHDRNSNENESENYEPFFDVD